MIHAVAGASSSFQRFILATILMILVGQILAADIPGRISVQGTQLMMGGQPIYLNGANSPWNYFNEFGSTDNGDYSHAWWNSEFVRLKAAGINSVRIWISCDGTEQPATDANGVVGVNAQFWSDVDDLMALATTHQIYVMATMMSFDHANPWIWDYNTNAHSTIFHNWLAMFNSVAGVQAMIDRYLLPFVLRYQDNPYLYAIDLCNEPEWINQNYGSESWANLQRYAARAAAAIHRSGSPVLVTIGSAGVKWNSNRYENNYWSDANLQAQFADSQARLDFYQIHYYQWMEPWYPLLPSAAGHQLTDRPLVLGELPGHVARTPAQDWDLPSGLTFPQIFAFLLANGYSGHYPWRSNGGTYGSLDDFGPSTLAFKQAHPDLVRTPSALVAPTITAQPSDQRIAVGQAATFTVVAAGMPAPTFAWQRSTDGGLTWIAVPGATTASYTTAVAGPGEVTSTSPPAIAPNPLISRGKPVYANPDPNARAAQVVNGHYYDDGWFPWAGADGSPAIIAIDLGRGPTSILINWTSTASTNYNETTYGGPGDYTVQVSGDSTNGSDGTWNTVATVVGNTFRTREHQIPFVGKRWVRLRITARSATCLAGAMNLDEIDVFDTSASAEDTWFFLGDSITAAAFRRQDAIQASFASLINTSHPGYFPLMINGGLGGYASAGIVPLIGGFLTTNPDCRYWAIGLGTNDAWNVTAGGAPTAVATFKSNLQTIITAIKGAGRIPILAKIPYAIGAAHDQTPAFNAAIDELNRTNGLHAGPDLYAHFQANQAGLGADGVHPNEQGSLAINRLWAAASADLYASGRSVSYRCIVTNSAGSVTTRAATLTVTTGRTIQMAVVPGHVWTCDPASVWIDPPLAGQQVIHLPTSDSAWLSLLPASSN